MSSPQSGTLRRDKPRIQFVKGFDGQQSKQLQETLYFKAGEQIRSGMVISKTYVTANSRYEWVAGLVANAVPFLADQDYDDADVVGAGGQITGYPLSSEFEVRTPWVKLTANDNATDNTGSWDDDVRLSAVARVVSDAQTSVHGRLKLAESSDPVVAYLSGGHKDGLLDVAAENTNVTPDANRKVLVAQLTANFVRGVVA